MTSPYAETVQQCIDACLNCAQSCRICLTACLHEPDVANRIECIRTLQDCIDICDSAVRFMTANSPYAMQVCDLCATICSACAQQCTQMQDEHCQMCATHCQECADACRSM
ncbi:four-helix bundle copper-binding protein [Mechercharimyces sp. CAU 1602]|nr:four-helix bundle copper-binding protein [Mechercharimyces sp. CAU 1602]